MIVDRPESNKLVGLYRGKVVRHLSHGRLKVFIPSVYPAEMENQPAQLPDAEMLVPMFGGNNMGNGVFSYPNVNSVVMCQFLNGDQNYPIVVGATQGASLAKQRYSEVANELDDSTGETPSCIHMVNVGKSKVKMYEGGQIEAQVAGDAGNSTIILDKNGNIFICCDKTLQIQAEDVKFITKNQMDLNGKNITVTAADQAVVQGSNVTVQAPTGRVIVKSSVNVPGKII